MVGIVVGVTVTSTKRAATDCSGGASVPRAYHLGVDVRHAVSRKRLMKRICETVTFAVPPVPNTELLVIRLFDRGHSAAGRVRHAVELGGAGNGERVGALLKLRLQAHVAPAIERQQ